MEEKLRLAESLAAADAPWGLSVGRRSALALQWLTSSLVAAQKGRHSVGLHLLPAAWSLLALLLRNQEREEREGRNGERASVAVTAIPPLVHEALAAHVRHWTPATSPPCLQWPPQGTETTALKSQETERERRERERHSCEALEAAAEVAEALELASAVGAFEASAALAAAALSAATEALQDEERRADRKRGREAAVRLARRALRALTAAAGRQASGSRRAFSAAVDGLLPAVLQLSLYVEERRWHIDSHSEAKNGREATSIEDVTKAQRERQQSNNDVDSMDIDSDNEDQIDSMDSSSAGTEAMEEEEELLAVAAAATRACLFDGASTTDYALVLSGVGEVEGAYAGTGIRSYQRRLFSRLQTLAKDEKMAAATLAGLPLLLQCFTAAHSAQQEARAARARAKEMASRASNSNSAAALASDGELLEMRFLLELHSISASAIAAAPEGMERQGARRRALAAAQAMLCCIAPHHLPQARAGRAPLASSSPLAPVVSLLEDVAEERDISAEKERKKGKNNCVGAGAAEKAARALACDSAGQLLRLEHSLILSRPDLLWSLLEPLGGGVSSSRVESSQAALLRRLLAVHLLLRQTEAFVRAVLEAADKSRSLTASLLSGKLPLLSLLQSASRRLPAAQLSPLFRLTANYLSRTENESGSRELAAALIEALAAGASCTEASAVALEVALSPVCEALLPPLSSIAMSNLFTRGESAEEKKKREKKDATKRKKEERRRSGQGRESLGREAGLTSFLSAGDAAAIVGSALAVRCLLQECKVAQATDDDTGSDADEFFAPLAKEDIVAPRLSPLLNAAGTALRDGNVALRGNEEQARLHVRILHCAVRAVAELQLCHAPSAAAEALTAAPVAHSARELILAWLPLLAMESYEDEGVIAHVKSAAHCLTSALPQMAPLLPPSALFRLCLLALLDDGKRIAGQNGQSTQGPLHEAAERGGRCKGLREAAALALTLPLLEAALKIPGAPQVLYDVTKALREAATTAAAQKELERVLTYAAETVSKGRTAKKVKGRSRDTDDVDMEDAGEEEVWQGLESRLALLAIAPAHSLPPTVASALAMAVAHVANAAQAHSSHSNSRRRCLLLSHAWAARHTCDSFPIAIGATGTGDREGTAGAAAAAEVLLCAQAFGDVRDEDHEEESGVPDAARAASRALAQRKLSRWLSLAADGDKEATAEVMSFLSCATATDDSSGALALSAALSASQALLEGRECRAAAKAREQRREARALLMRREEKALVNRFQHSEAEMEGRDDDDDSSDDESETEGNEGGQESVDTRKRARRVPSKDKEKEEVPAAWLKPLEATASWLAKEEHWDTAWRMRLCARLLRCFRAAHARIWHCGSPPSLPLPLTALESAVRALESLASDIHSQRLKRESSASEETLIAEKKTTKSSAEKESRRAREERGVAGAAVAEALAACAFLPSARAALLPLGPRILTASFHCLESVEENDTLSHYSEVPHGKSKEAERERQQGGGRRGRGDASAAAKAAEGLLARLLAAADLRLSSSALAASLSALASGSAAEATAGATCTGLLAAKTQGRAARHLDSRGTELALALAAAIRRHPTAPALSNAALSAANSLLAAKRRLPLGPRAVAATLHVASAALTAAQRRDEIHGENCDREGDIGDVSLLLQTAVKHRRPESGRAASALLMVTRALLWRAAAVGGSRAWRSAARVLQCLAAAGGLARRHAGPLVAEALAVLQARAVPQDARRELRLGLFPLMDLCSSLDLQALFAGLDNTGKAFFQELHAAHSKLHRFRGKA